MKRILSLLALLVLSGNAAPLFAQESVETELELVRKLRDRGWNDLAKTKIEELIKRNDPVLNATLPLELARLNIAAARLQDPEQRLAAYAAARVLMDEFIAKNKGTGQAALAKVDVARLTTYHAQVLLSKAMREEDNKERHEKARPAETKFIEAGKELEEAIKLLDAAIQDPANAALKNTLVQELRQARFDLATNLFDQAKTYINRGNLKVAGQRGDIITKAQKAFITLRSDESSQIGWLANAWLMKCAMETDSPAEVVKYYKSVMDRANEKGIQANIQPAVRLVRYFHMQDQTLPRPDEPETMGSNHVSGNLKKPPSPMDRLKAVEKEGEAWLKAYPAYVKTYEGQGVRYELAHAYLAQAYEFEKDKAPKDKTLAEKTFKLAGMHFKVLGEYDGELANRSRDVAMWLESKTVKEGKTELKTFDQFITKGMIERKNVIAISRKADDPKADQKAVEAERKKHLKEAINAFSKALTLVDGNTSATKQDDARIYLCGAYLAYGDPYRAAVVAEQLGRSRPNGRGAEGAATAIATYAALQDRHPDDAAIKNRLNDLAEFVLSPQGQKNWAANPVTSRAHYYMGMAAKKDNNPKKAIGHLEKITPDFTDYVYTQGQCAFIAEAARTGTEDKAEQQWYTAAARAAIKRMPKITPKNEVPSVIAMYFFAKVEESKYQYMEGFDHLNAKDKEELKAIKSFNDMAAYVKGLRAELEQVPPHIGKDDYVPNGRISKQHHEQLQFTMAVMLKYADLGVAEVRFRGDTKDRFDQVLAATKGVVDDTLAKAQATPAGQYIKMKDYKVTGDILSLALRANVQKGQEGAAKGKVILDVLQRLADEEGKPKSGNAVAVLLNDIAGQIKAMKEKNDKSLVDTKANYTAFLDVISAELEKNGFDNNSVVLMAHAYNSLGYPAKAAPLFAKYKAPANVGKKLEKPKKETEKEMEARQQAEEEVGRYWGVQIEHIRALRECKDKDSLKTAEEIAKKLLADPTAKYHLQAMMEKNFLIEDQGRFLEAYSEWSAKFMKMPSITGPNLAKPEVQKIYFTAYFYQIRTLYKTALFDKTIKDRPKLIEACAKQIIKLEFTKGQVGWKIAEPHFKEFFKDPDADKLKKEYDKLKVLQEKSSLWNPNASGERLAIADTDIEIDVLQRLTNPERERGDTRCPCHCAEIIRDPVGIDILAVRLSTRMGCCYPLAGAQG